MEEEIEVLCDSLPLLRLLDHYADAGDREAWQDRVMELADAPPRDLARWHGELIARGWVEQNTGAVPVLRAGAAPGCYRVTSAGRRALQMARAGRMVNKEVEAA